VAKESGEESREGSGDASVADEPEAGTRSGNKKLTVEQ